MASVLPEVVKPAGAYDPAISRKKALNQTILTGLAGLGGMFLFVVTSLAADADAISQLMGWIRRHPVLGAYAPAIILALNYALKWWRDRAKHMDVSYHVEHGVPIMHAADLALKSGAAPSDVREDIVEAVVKEAVKEQEREVPKP